MHIMAADKETEQATMRKSTIGKNEEGGEKKQTVIHGKREKKTAEEYKNHQERNTAKS